MDNKQMHSHAYRGLAVTLICSFLIMYAVMFLNVFDSSHIYLSLTRFYMALLMVAPMAVLMIARMGMMYMNRKKNIVVIISSCLVFILALTTLRNQVFVSDIQYMKAMIPHHSSAILTSSSAGLKDPEVRALADSIIASQEREIAQMKQAIRRLEN